MKRFTLTSLAAICMLCHGCGVTKPQPTVITIVKDSVRTEVHERVVHDTVDFVPPEFFASYTSTDTLSFIENKYAKSTAIVHDGLLTHTLESVPNVIRIPVQVQVHDTLVIEKHDASDTITEYVEVEKELTFWQKLFITTGKVSGLILIAIGAYFIIKAIVLMKRPV